MARATMIVASTPVSFVRGCWLVGIDTPDGHDDDAITILAQAAFLS